MLPDVRFGVFFELSVPRPFSPERERDVLENGLGQARLGGRVRETNHPIRVAERAAFLDLLSGGRLEFGTARSSTWTEIGGFQADPDATKKDWDEYVRVLPRMWMQEDRKSTRLN